MKIGFIGAGKMAEAIIAALINSKLFVPHQIFAGDVSSERRKLLKRRYGINTYSNNNAIPGMAEIIFLSVKPQQLVDVLNEISGGVNKRHLVISIAAGKKISFIQSLFSTARIARVMPNLACLVSEAMSVFCVGKTATVSDKKTVTRILSCFGKVAELPESRFDTVTALSGSGPAFFTYFLESMVNAGTKEGLSRKDALALAVQTMLGTSKLLMEKKIDPEELIMSVTSEKGTTAAGLEVMENSELSKIVCKTIKAAAKRSKELSA
ncbi:pyrroline-5-carboxylate reductase [Verrucomicrobiota bacterium]